MSSQCGRAHTPAPAVRFIRDIIIVNIIINIVKLVNTEIMDNQLVKVFKQAKLVKMVINTHSENWELSNKSRSMIITVFQIKL